MQQLFFYNAKLLADPDIVGKVMGIATSREKESYDGPIFGHRLMTRGNWPNLAGILKGPRDWSNKCGEKYLGRKVKPLWKGRWILEPHWKSKMHFDARSKIRWWQHSFVTKSKKMGRFMLFKYPYVFRGGFLRAVGEVLLCPIAHWVFAGSTYSLGPNVLRNVFQTNNYR